MIENLLAGYVGTIRLSDEQIREGINREIAIRVAQERITLLVEAQQAYIQSLVGVYQLDPEAYRLIDWISGFEPIVPIFAPAASHSGAGPNGGNPLGPSGGNPLGGGGEYGGFGEEG